MENKKETNDEIKSKDLDFSKIEFENTAVARHGLSYDEKADIFEQNVNFRLKTSAYIGQITKEDMKDVYELFNYGNLILTKLSIFMYNDKVMSMGGGGIHNDFEHGKYLELIPSEIENYLKEGYLVFLFSIVDSIYNNKEIKYDTVVLTNNTNKMENEKFNSLLKKTYDNVSEFNLLIQELKETFDSFSDEDIKLLAIVEETYKKKLMPEIEKLEKLQNKSN